MIALDLRITLFVASLGLAALLGSTWWLVRHRAVWGFYGSELVWQILNTLPFGVMIVDGDGDTTMRNAAVQQLLHTTEELQQVFKRLGNQTLPTVARSGLLTQPVPLRWWSYPFDHRQTLVVLADNADQQRFVRQQQTFVGQLSHELRTPLTALATHIEIVRNPQTPDSVYHAALETMERETQRMAHLVRDLLELHRLETADDLLLQPTDVVLVAEDAIAQMILEADKRGLQLTFDTDGHLPLLAAHPDRLKQVFLNVLGNAIEYCRYGDTIRVRLERQATGVRCMVQDTGLGIDPTDLPRVTERLYRGKTGKQGTGIGLALVKEILNRHHAELVIESSTEGPAAGTTVSWTLPYVEVDGR